MNKKILLYGLLFLTSVFLVYAALGDPFQFKDSSGVATAWVGGNDGIVNATGNIHTKAHFILEEGNKTCLNGPACTSYILNNGTGVIIK